MHQRTIPHIIHIHLFILAFLPIRCLVRLHHSQNDCSCICKFSGTGRKCQNFRFPHLLQFFYCVFPQEKTVLFCIRKQSMNIRLPSLWVEDYFLSCLRQQARKNSQSIRFIRQKQCTRSMILKKGLLFIKFQISEHTTFFHIMSIQQRICVGKIPLIASIQINTAGKGKISVYISVDICQIGTALQYRVILTEKSAFS